MSVQENKPQLSVVVLTCGAPEITLQCLEHILAARGIVLELLVVCNGADATFQAVLDGFALRAECLGIRCCCIWNDVNVGACTGRNQALAEARGECIAFLDNDVFCKDQDLLARCVNLLLSDERIGMVGPRLVNSACPEVLECAGYAVDPQGRLLGLGSGQSEESPVCRSVREVQAVGNFIARTQVMRDIGGFDTAFDPFGFENVDCCYRAKARGLTIVCDGRSDLHHVGHVTTGDWEENGKRVLFSKSMVLRRKWQAAFEREAAICRRLLAESSVQCSGVEA